MKFTVEEKSKQPTRELLFDDNYQAEIMFFHNKRTHSVNLLLTFWQYRDNKGVRSKQGKAERHNT